MYESTIYLYLKYIVKSRDVTQRFLSDRVNAFLLLCLPAVSMPSPLREIGTLIVVVLKAVSILVYCLL